MSESFSQLSGFISRFRFTKYHNWQPWKMPQCIRFSWHPNFATDTTPCFPYLISCYLWSEFDQILCRLPLSSLYTAMYLLYDRWVIISLDHRYVFFGLKEHICVLLLPTNHISAFRNLSSVQWSSTAFSIQSDSFWRFIRLMFVPRWLWWTGWLAAEAPFWHWPTWPQFVCLIC